MAKSVEDGVIRVMSPSMLNKFDATVPFGCERRWWFRYVKGLEEPQVGNQQLGEKVHALIEAFLLKQEVGMQMEAEDDAFGIYLAGQQMIEDVAKRRILGVEAQLADFKLDGTRVQGYVDVVTEDGIIDWKTSSDIRRYGKTAEDLATDTQMTIYALAMHPDLASVKLAHGQFQTKGSKRTAFVEVGVSQQHLASHRDNVIIPLVQRMKSAASEADVRKLPKNEKSCFNCAFKAHCPGDESVMSFFNKMKKQESTPASMAVVNGGDMAAKTEPAVQPVLPPDAPESDPALAAKPVENFSAVPPPRRQLLAEEPKPLAVVEGPLPAPVEPPKPEVKAEEPAPVKRGRGRPPGSKNKKTDTVKLADFTVLNPVSPERAAELDAEIMAEEPGEVRYVASAINAQPSVAIKSVTVTKGYTVNLGAFNNVRFEVSVTGEGSDLEAVYSTLMGEVEERMAAEAAKYEAEVDQKTKAMKPATDVVCK